MKSLRLSAALIATVALAAASGAYAQAPEASRHLGKLDLALRQALKGGAATQHVIIRVTPGARGSVRERLERQGDHVYTEHAVINALSARVHRSDLEALARDAQVESVSIDAVIGADARPGPQTTSTSAGLLRATLGLTGTTRCGAGIGVAIVDTGIEDTNDLDDASGRKRITAFYDYTKGGILAYPYDDSGHGTHVAGLVGGNGDLSNGDYVGVAPCVRLIGFKVLNKYGAGSTSVVISAIEFAIANKAALGIDVINLSLGHPVYESAATDPLVQVVERAVRAGIVVVASAGNNGRNKDTGAIGYAGIASPGNAPSAITVGDFRMSGTVTRRDDRVATYSSRGPTWSDGFAKPDLVAPGNRLVSNSSRGSYLYNKADSEQKQRFNYITLSGTSMAAGVTSGAAALVLEASRAANPSGAPALTPNAVKAILQYTAFRMRDDAGVEYDRLTQGAGALNAAGAIELASIIETSVPEGQYWLSGGFLSTTVIDGEVLPWSENIVWGSDVLRGGALIDFHQSAWSTSIIWGDGAADNIVWGSSSDDNIVWGSNILQEEDNIVWGSSFDWGDNIVWGSNLIGMNLGFDNIVWGSDNIVWGSLTDDNIVWGSLNDPTIVSGNANTVNYLIVADWKSY